MELWPGIDCVAVNFEGEYLLSAAGRNFRTFRDAGSAGRMNWLSQSDIRINTGQQEFGTAPSLSAIAKQRQGEPRRYS